MAYTGVEKAYAIQAGRELRVIVEADKVTDQDSEKLSFEIAQKIQTEMTFPGPDKSDRYTGKKNGECSQVRNWNHVLEIKALRSAGNIFG